jgi:hypothetical protein
VKNRPLLRRGLRAGVYTVGLAAAVLGVAGCSTKREVVVPAPNAFLAPQPESAKSSDRGVEIVVQTNAWSGHPPDLGGGVIALKVTIENHSLHLLAIRYSSFALVEANDRRYTDIPPYGVTGRSYEHLQPRWAFSDAHYISVPLPTEQLLEKGIAEGTVSESGTTTGFLYFQKPAPRSQAISFEAVLVDARTGERFGRIVVPLLVKAV